MEKAIFERTNLSNRRNWIRPNKCDFPDIDLPICDNVGSRRSQMAVDPCSDSITRLPNVNRNAVQIAQHVTTNLIGKRANCTTPKS